MPVPYIKKLASEGKGSIDSLEKKWSDAKAKAKEEGKGDNYAYITEIFKKMAHASVEASADKSASEFRINLLARIFAHNEPK